MLDTRKKFYRRERKVYKYMHIYLWTILRPKFLDGENAEIKFLPLRHQSTKFFCTEIEVYKYMHIY